MKKILLYLLLINTVTLVYAQDMQIKITQDQIDKLAIKLDTLKLTHQVPLLYAPAKVVVPGYHEYLLSSPQPGLVSQLHANIGDSVQKNQLLATINSPELLNLQRDFLTVANELQLSELDYKRDEKLLEEGVIADRRWQQTQTLHHSKVAQFDSARQLLQMAGMSGNEISELKQSGKLSSLLNLHAPASGVVLERFVTLGARLDMQAPLYRLADLSELWLEINIPQERLNAIIIGDLVQIENTTITANISLLGQSVNRENQTVLARGVIKGKQPQLKVGQNVNVQIMQNSQQAGFKVINAAISQYEGHNYIFVRNKDGFLVTEVNIIGKQGEESLINVELTGKEQIAVKGTVALKANWLGLGGYE
ncbi:efflux RND transporter periplasmic adaptor subunit [Methylomonas sp. AM2-LC]|uniref:efflux RND transporter periplasmic adaptor subunit n=1 Tax=Methylomonas sp. AM2-LC TaxID=3153301 RepID=UPI0032633089